jgi:outer membrane protein assembly factor BamB
MILAAASPRPLPYALLLLGSFLGSLFLVEGNWEVRAENWPRWRGPDGSGVSSEKQLPWKWSDQQDDQQDGHEDGQRDKKRDKQGIRWEYTFPGEGASSPIVWEDRVFLTSAERHGGQRHLLCLDRDTGVLRWQGTVEDENPELTSALTGHAAATPVTDGEVVIGFFGNAGLVAYDLEGNPLWHRKLGEFDTELGLSSSPVLSGDLVLQVGDHDGDARNSFDSFVIALDRRTGKPRWRTTRPGRYRSWSTPIVVPVEGGKELIVNGQDALQAYDVETGVLRWSWEGMSGWVTPSPLYDGRKILATSGRDGPVVALEPPSARDSTNGTPTPVPIWHHERGGPYVCSPLYFEGHLFVHDERGVLSTYEGETGKLLDRQRLEGRFYASGAAGDGRIYLSNDRGITYVLRPGPVPQVVAENDIREEILASPAISQGAIWLRTRTRLLCISSDDD